MNKFTPLVSTAFCPFTKDWCNDDCALARSVRKDGECGDGWYCAIANFSENHAGYFGAVFYTHGDSNE